MIVGKKSYGLIKLIIIPLVLSVFISSAAAFEVNQLQWAQGISGKLKQDDIISYNGYSVRAIGFPGPFESDRYKNIPAEPVDPYVALNISKNGIFINKTVLALGESFVVPDGELRITATGLPPKDSSVWLFESYDPWATVDLSPRGTPKLEIQVETDKTEYLSATSTEINAIVTLKNTGTASASNVDVTLKTDLPIKRGELNYHYDKIEKGTSNSMAVTFSTPLLQEMNNYDMLANVTGFDVKDIFYTGESSKTISITPEPLVSLSIHKTTNDKIYLKDLAIVSLSVKNNGKDDLKNVSITDSLPDEFKLTNNNSLHWVVDLPVGGDWDFHYLIKPVESNSEGITLPAASAGFNYRNKNYLIQSNSPSIVVYGPKITLTKQADVTQITPGDSVTITTVAENKGSTPTKIFIQDDLPKEATIIRGNTTLEDYLEANKAVSFSYTIKINSDTPVTLPSATAEYYELGNMGNKLKIASQAIEIGIKPPEVIPTEEAPAPEIATPEPTEVTPEPTPTEPQIQEPANPVDTGNQVASPAEINSILSFMLGCDDVANSSVAAPVACNFYGLGNDSSVSIEK